MTVDWTNDSTNGTSYQWTFTGANSTSSTDEEPADSTYAVAGNFNVTLRVDNAYGWSSLTKAGYVTVYGTPFNRACFIMADHHRGR
jgi:PKD repeat protein